MRRERAVASVARSGSRPTASRSCPPFCEQRLRGSGGTSSAAHVRREALARSRAALLCERRLGSGALPTSGRIMAACVGSAMVREYSASAAAAAVSARREQTCLQFLLPESPPSLFARACRPGFSGQCGPRGEHWQRQAPNLLPVSG